MPPKKRIRIGRLTADAKRARASRQAQSLEERELCLEKYRSYQRWIISQETPEERASRLSVMRSQARRRRARILAESDRRKVLLTIERVRNGSSQMEEEEDQLFLDCAVDCNVKIEEQEDWLPGHSAAEASSSSLKQEDWLSAGMGRNSDAQAPEGSLKQEEVRGDWQSAGRNLNIDAQASILASERAHSKIGVD